jgi:hypothetical protein
VFTQVDRLDKEVRAEAIEMWTESSFDILKENDIILPKENFYVLRSG